MSTTNTLHLNINCPLESLAECHGSVHHSQTVLPVKKKQQPKLQHTEIIFMSFFSETSSLKCLA